MNNENLFNRKFLGMCLSSMLFMASFNLIIPELNDYLTQLGGGAYKGFIIFSFAGIGLISRPFTGKLADLIGRKPLMIFGTLICFIAGFIYPIVDSIALFFVLRCFHGISVGFTPTGITAYLADVVPANKRGVAMGLLGVFMSTGMALAHPIGSFIALKFGLNTMFFTSSILGIISGLTFIPLTETLENKRRFKLSMLLIKLEDLFEPRVIPVFILMALSAFSFGALITIASDTAVYVGFINKGIPMLVYVIASIFIRTLTSSTSDKIGRANTLFWGFGLLIIGMTLAGFAHSQVLLLVAFGVVGLGAGINSPTLFAWTVDLSLNEKRGRGMSTMYVALEGGIMLGAAIGGWIYGNMAANFKYVFWAGAVLALIAFIYLIYYKTIRNVQSTHVKS